MPIFSVGEICERALRKIGAYAIRDAGARPEDLEEARRWLHMVIMHQSAKMRTPWLVTRPAGSIDLAASTQDYDLRQLLGGKELTDGLQFIVSVYLYDVDQAQDVREIALLKRLEWEAIENKAETGEPERAWIDRSRYPIMHLHPIPDGERTLQARVLFQEMASSFVNRPFNDRTYAMHEAWNLWVVTGLAAEIGNGPVRKLPKDEVAEMKSSARLLLQDLESYDQFEQANEPRQAAYWDGIS